MGGDVERAKAATGGMRFSRHLTERALRRARRLAAEGSIDKAVDELHAIRRELDLDGPAEESLHRVRTLLGSHLTAIGAVRDAGGANQVVARLARQALDAAEAELMGASQLAAASS